MAQYKVIQDIEAEDKLLGPLTLKQFIYAAVTIILGFIAFKLSTSLHSIYVIFIFLPPILFFGLLAAPFGIDQPNEVWLLAKFRFFLKPQVRKWDQDGIGSLVTVTVPKKIEKRLTKDFTSTEAKSRLESLAKTLDSGGWASSNSTPKLVIAGLNGNGSGDRLVDLDSMSKIPVSESTATDDMFDDNNPQAQHISSVMTENEQKIRNYQRNLMNPSEYPHISASQTSITGAGGFMLPKNYMKDAPDEPVFGHIEPSINQQATPGLNVSLNNSAQNNQTSVTSQPDNAKISVLARDNNLSIASIKRELRGGDDSGEVVISLH